MSELLTDYMFGVTVFMAIFAIVDPMGNIPIFYTITQRFTKEERIRIAKKAIIAATITLFVFALIGQYIFMLFSIIVTGISSYCGMTTALFAFL